MIQQRKFLRNEIIYSVFRLSIMERKCTRIRGSSYAEQCRSTRILKANIICFFSSVVLIVTWPGNVTNQWTYRTEKKPGNIWIPIPCYHRLAWPPNIVCLPAQHWPTRWSGHMWYLGMTDGESPLTIIIHQPREILQAKKLVANHINTGGCTHFRNQSFSVFPN